MMEQAELAAAAAAAAAEAAPAGAAAAVAGDEALRPAATDVRPGLHV